jgi:plasmid stability protein
MRLVPHLHVRNVPPEVYESLTARARREGRSLNAEVLRILDAAAAEEARSGDWIRRLDELRREFLLPEDAPGPEEVIREARDERSRRL